MHDKIKLNEFVITNPSLQRILEELLNLKIKTWHPSGPKKVESNDVTKYVYNRKDVTQQ